MDGTSCQSEELVEAHSDSDESLSDAAITAMPRSRRYPAPQHHTPCLADTSDEWKTAGSTVGDALPSVVVSDGEDDDCMEGQILVLNPFHDRHLSSSDVTGPSRMSSYLWPAGHFHPYANINYGSTPVLNIGSERAYYQHESTNYTSAPALCVDGQHVYHNSP